FTTSLIVLSLSSPFNTNKFKPTGGEISANSMFIIIITANHIGSNPRVVITGYNIGSEINKIETVSKNIPKINKVILIMMNTSQGETSIEVDASTISCGILSRVKI